MDDQTARTDHIWRLSKALELTAHVYESCVSVLEESALAPC